MRIVVVHYVPSEAIELAERMRREGFDAEPYRERGSKGFRGLRENPPAAIVIDLTRMPFYGQWIGCEMRANKGTRTIPLVYIKGEPAKTAKVRALLPDAVFTTVPKIGDALKKAIEHPPKNPVAPKPQHQPAAPKLHIREDSVVALLRAPKGFADALGKLPDGVRMQKKVGEANVVLSFVKSTAELGRELPILAKELRPGRSVWVLWPKQASKAAGDVTVIRIGDMCALYGLTGYKSCAVDETWSAIALAARKKR